MPFYMRNGKRYYRMPDREEGPRGKNVKICLATLGLIVFLDLMATLATRTNAHLLDVMQELLAPISWLFEALGVPITSAYFDGPESQVYYRVLLLLSALLGQSLGVPIAYHFCKRFRFFKYPA